MFQFVLKLVVVKKVRQKLSQMRRYLTVCRIADELRLVRESIGNKRHLMQTVDMYSVADLVAVENGTLPEFLRKVHINFERHIRNCVVSCGIVTGSNWNLFISPNRSVPQRLTSARYATTTKYCFRSTIAPSLVLDVIRFHIGHVTCARICNA